MRLLTLQLAVTSAWFLWSAPAPAQPPESFPSYVTDMAAPDVLGQPAGCDVNSYTPCCPAECPRTCRRDCHIGGKMLADMQRALRILLIGRGRCCCSCESFCCSACCTGDSAAGDMTMGPGDVEIVPRSSWPPEYRDVPPPPQSVTRSVMRLQRDAYARQTASGPTLAADPARSRSGQQAAFELPPGEITAALVAEGQPPQGGFTAIATDLTD